MLKQIIAQSACAALLLGATFSAGAEGVNVIGVQEDGEKAILKQVKLDWYTQNTTSNGLASFTVNEETTMLVHVENFNFLHYELDSNITEVDVEAAGYLIDLYASVFALSEPDNVIAALNNDLPLGVMEVAPLNKFKIWLDSLDMLRNEATDILNANKSSSAIDSKDKFKDYKTELECRITHANKNQESAFQALVEGKSNLSPETFKLIREKHGQVLDYVNTVLGRVNLSLKGKTIVVGKKQRATAVTVDLLAIPLPSASPQNIQPQPDKARCAQAKTPVESVAGALDDNQAKEIKEPRAMRVEYLVQGQIPLLFHSGLTYSTLKDAEFETLQELSGSEFQTRVVEGDDTIGLSLFASYPLSGKLTGDNKWFFTLGTDITDIGDTVYGGLSYSFRDNWLVSAGLAYGDTVETSTMSASSMNMLSNSEQRDIVQIIEQDRDTEPFISISYKFF